MSAIALCSAWTVGARAESARLPRVEMATACLETDAPDDDYMRNWIATWADGATRRTMSVRGVGFVDQPASLLREYMRLVPAAQPERTVAGTTCTTVECALDERFGKGVGLRLLFMLLRHGFDGSQLDRPEAQPWTREELDDVLLALSDLPASATPQRPVALLLTSERASSDEAVRIDPSWTGLPRQARRFAVFVAVAGHFETRMSQRPEFGTMWMAALGGEAIRQPELLRLAGLPAIGPQPTPGSDMSIGAALYRYAPESLMATVPKLYALLRETFFDGLEYRHAEQCGAGRSLSGMAERIARAKLERAVMTDANRAIVAEQCALVDAPGPDCAPRALFRAYLLKARLQLATFAPEVAMAAFEAGLTPASLARRTAAASVSLAVHAGAARR